MTRGILRVILVLVFAYAALAGLSIRVRLSYYQWEARENSYLSTPGVVWQSSIAFPHESGHLPIFSLADGSLEALYRAQVPLWQAADADGRLLVGTGDGSLLVFDESVRKS